MLKASGTANPYKDLDEGLPWTWNPGEDDELHYVVENDAYGNFNVAFHVGRASGCWELALRRAWPNNHIARKAVKSAVWRSAAPYSGKGRAQLKKRALEAARGLYGDVETDHEAEAIWVGHWWSQELTKSNS